MDSTLFKRALSFSVGAHLLALLFSLVFAQLSLSPSAPKDAQILWLDPTDLAELQKLQPKNQIVQSEAGKQVERAREDAYLGRENRVVEKESVASSTETASSPAASAASQPKAQQQAQSSTEKQPTLSDLGVKMFRQPAAIPAPDTPQWKSMNSDLGVAPQDHVKGVQETETTALNTREFIYFSYYQRIRDQLERAWRPLLQNQLARLFRTGRNPASNMEHVTRTVVTLDSKGEVIRVQVLEESGTRDLDDAAIRAFNEAGPFPNPPRGLVEETGQVKIQWQFVLRT
jgi:protein TonB